MKEYVATLRASFKADDDAEAILIADNIASKAYEILDEDDGDEVVITQVIDYAPADTPQEVINVLAKARNTLIHSRLASMINLAKEMDKVIASLENGDYTQLAPYDHGRFIDLVEAVLAGKSPL